MDLPFAVDSTDAARSSTFHQSSGAGSSSLVTASSHDSGLFPDQYNTPHTSNTRTNAAATITNHNNNMVMMMGPTIVAEQGDGDIGLDDDIETIDFASSVTVSETDADEVDIVIDAGQPPEDGAGGFVDNAMAKGDVLAVLLSGAAQQGETVVVRSL